jgi:hypothetical protein
LTANRAYTLAQAGDTVWALPGTYSSNRLGFTSGSAPTSKTVTDSMDCHSSQECVYFTPQPGQEANVVTGEIDWKASFAPQHLYYKGFVRGACPSFSPVNFTGSTSAVNDITADGFVNDLDTDADCVPYIAGPHTNVRVLNGDFQHYCTAGSAGGFQIQSNQQDQGGEATNVAYVPSDILIEGNRFEHVNNNCTINDHQDCIHQYASLDMLIIGNTFVNCWDSSILAGGLDVAGVQENNAIVANFFGPTQLGTNNCCLRGDTTPSKETFDGWVIAFNSSSSTWMNKSGNVLNNVQFIGNVGLGTVVCRGGGDTNVTWKYNVMGSAACDATDNGGETNTTVKFADTTAASLDLHIGAGSVAENFVPSSQSGGCAAWPTDFDGATRPATCDAGADER